MEPPWHADAAKQHCTVQTPLCMHAAAAASHTHHMLATAMLHACIGVAGAQDCKTGHTDTNTLCHQDGAIKYQQADSACALNACTDQILWDPHMWAPCTGCMTVLGGPSMVAFTCLHSSGTLQVDHSAGIEKRRKLLLTTHVSYTLHYYLLRSNHQCVAT